MSYTTIVATRETDVPRRLRGLSRRRPARLGGLSINARWRIRPLLAVATAAAAMLIASQASAAIITLQQGLDSYTHQDTTVRLDGTNANATNNTTRSLAGSVGNANPPGPLRAIFSFPLGSLPAGAIINSAVFKIGSDPDTGASVNANFTVELRSISTSFNEATANWTNTFGGGMTLGGVVHSSATMNPEGALAVHTFASSPTLVAAIQSAFNGSLPFNFALVAQPAVETSASRTIFRLGSNTSNQNLIDPQRPTLEIDYTVREVPEPATAGVVLVAAASLLAVARRSRGD